MGQLSFFYLRSFIFFRFKRLMAEMTKILPHIFFLVIIVVAMIISQSSLTSKRVPLHKSLAGSMFIKSMIETSTFSLRQWFSKLVHLMSLKISKINHSPKTSMQIFFSSSIQIKGKQKEASIF